MKQPIQGRIEHLTEQLEELLVVNEKLRETCRERFVKIEKLEAEIARLRGW